MRRWSCWSWLWSEPIYAAQDVGEQIFRDGDFGHLERDVAPVAHDLRADLDQLLPQRRHGPVLYFPQQVHRPHEVAEIVSQGVKLKLDRVIVKLLA